MVRLALLAGVGLAALATTACSEEDRRAWVSILPLPGRDEDEAEEPPAGGPFGLSSDSTAVLFGADTVFTLARVPERGPDGGALAPTRIRHAALSPDSSAIGMIVNGAAPAVVVWSRPRQTAVVAAAFPGGAVTRIDWSSDGRLLAFEGRDERGLARSGVYDVEAARTGRHPALQWLARQGRSIRFQDWADERHPRFLVSPAGGSEGGLAYVWDIERGAFLLESHARALASSAPAGMAAPGGVLSFDVAGDPAPETIVLYRSVTGAPAAMVLVDAGPGGVRPVVTDPLVPIEALGFEKWDATTSGPGLYQIAEIGGRPTLLLHLPATAPIPVIGLFQARADGRLETVTVASASGGGAGAPALFADGTVGNETRQLGIADLDGDGSAEVVLASGQGDPVFGGIQWSAEVYRWETGRLVAAPALEAAALERIERLAPGG